MKYFVITFGLFVAVIAGASNKPNVILIMADDMGYECIAANGSEDYKTPNLDKLAKEGVRFTQCFSNPKCTPSRVKLMTGMYNSRNYTKFGELHRSQTTFAHLLKNEGYATAIAGKWQLGSQDDSPQHFGFEQSCLWQHTRGRHRSQPHEGKDSRYPNPQLEINGAELEYTNGEYGPDICNKFICDFITEKKNEPFFAYYPMILTHCPFDATPDSKKWNPNSFGALEYKGHGTKSDQNQRFSEMVNYADKLVGNVIETLNRHGLRENTLIIFLGDNGTDIPIVTHWNGQKVVGGKGKVKDEGTRVPCIVNWPSNINPSVNKTELIDFSDFLPTLCDVTGASLPQDYANDGVSLWPVLTQTGERDKPWIYMTYKGTNWARNINYGVLQPIKTKDILYQKYDGHYKSKNVNFNESTEEDKTIFEELRSALEQLNKDKVFRIK